MNAKMHCVMSIYTELNDKHKLQGVPLSLRLEEEEPGELSAPALCLYAKICLIPLGSSTHKSGLANKSIA